MVALLRDFGQDTPMTLLVILIVLHAAATACIAGLVVSGLVQAVVSFGWPAVVVIALVAAGVGWLVSCAREARKP